MNVNKKELKDVLIRTLKTFLAAGIASAGTFGIDNWKVWLSTFAAAGITAVLNLMIKALGDGNYKTY